MLSLWCRLSDRIRDKFNKRANKRRHKKKSTDHDSRTNSILNDITENRQSKSEDCADNFSPSKNGEAIRPKLTNLFPDLDIRGDEVHSYGKENSIKPSESTKEKMLQYVPRMTQEMCMSQILFGAKFEDCLERCRSDLDLRNFGLFDSLYNQIESKPNIDGGKNVGPKINTRQRSHTTYTENTNSDVHDGGKDVKIPTVSVVEQSPSLANQNSYMFGGDDDEMLY